MQTTANSRFEATVAETRHHDGPVLLVVPNINAFRLSAGPALTWNSYHIMYVMLHARAKGQESRKVRAVVMSRDISHDELTGPGSLFTEAWENWARDVQADLYIRLIGPRYVDSRVTNLYGGRGAKVIVDIYDSSFFSSKGSAASLPDLLAASYLQPNERFDDTVWGIEPFFGRGSFTRRVEDDQSPLVAVVRQDADPSNAVGTTARYFYLPFTVM